jgi:hypothetical protein
VPARVQSQVEHSEPEGNLDGFLAGTHKASGSEGRWVKVDAEREKTIYREGNPN